MIDLIEYTEETSAEGVVLSLDFEKCFDRVDIKALIEALKYFGVKESFIRWTKLIYNGPVAAVSNNGFLSRWFEVTRSVKQGGPCSCYFFLAIAEVLAVELRKNPNIKGFMINEIKSILGQFADDMDLYLNDKKSVDEAIKTISTFEKSSGFKVNYDKTVLYRLGSLAKVDAQKYCAKLSWSETELNILGVNITHKIEKTIQSNYERILVKVGATLNVWRRRNLSLVGKVLIINTLAVSLFKYQMLVLPTIEESVVKKFNAIINDFFWSSRKPKISMQTLQLEKFQGGLGLVDIVLKDKSLKINWVKWINEDKYLAEFAFRKLCPVLWEDIWQVRLNQSDIKRLFVKSFWRDVLFSWSEYNMYEAASSPQDILKEMIW